MVSGLRLPRAPGRADGAQGVLDAHDYRAVNHDNMPAPYDLEPEAILIRMRVDASLWHIIAESARTWCGLFLSPGSDKRLFSETPEDRRCEICITRCGQYVVRRSHDSREATLAKERTRDDPQGRLFGHVRPGPWPVSRLHWQRRQPNHGTDSGLRPLDTEAIRA